jgi:FAD-dependent halogenase
MDERWDVVIVGAGPAGSTAAGYLAPLGYRTLLLERGRFPRHRIGESLLPSMMPVLEDFGLVDACREAGFVEKTGATFIWGRSREPWDIRFQETPFLPSSVAFHVERSVFDQILLDSARRRGAHVRMNASALGPLTDGDRVVGLTYRDNDTGEIRSVAADMVVDASGSASVIGQRLTTRRYDEQMCQMALYRYFRDIRGAGDFRSTHIVVESCPRGWFWFIPMNSERLGEASVGLVTGREFEAEIQELGAERFYDEALAESSYVGELLGPDATHVSKMRGVRDWAYSCDETAGPGYYLAGDAAAFLDPLLSTGVSLAMLAGYSASVCIHSALCDPSSEEAAAAFYADNYRTMYEVTRDFLHYFYAGNAVVHPDELFWKARSLLRLDENLGAKQAFSLFINTLPGNPHPALQKQIPLFRQFMANLDHPVPEVVTASGAQRIAGSRSAGEDGLRDDDVPVINGTLKASWMIDRDRHRLEPIVGVAYDRERPVFSSTSSWLLGRNIAPLEDDPAGLLSLVDGEEPWLAITERYASLHGMSPADGKDVATEIIRPLLAQDYVLVHSANTTDAVPQR